MSDSPPNLDTASDGRAQELSAAGLAPTSTAEGAAGASLETIYDGAPVGLVFIDTELRLQRVNAAIAEMSGLTAKALVGGPVCNIFPAAADELEPLLRLAIGAGQPIPPTEIEDVAAVSTGARRCWLVSANPVRSGAEIVGLSIVVREITDRKRSEERMTLLNSELHHRVKNVLATVQAIARSTARGVDSVEAFEQRFSARLSSLAKTHSLLVAKNRDAASIRDLVCAELEPYGDQATQRLNIDGPDVELPALLAVPFGMALHELTTNAAKHGALSMIGGCVSVTWSCAGERLVLSWVEEGGPPVAPPKRHGFGSQLLERVLGAQIKARVSRDFAPAGLRVRIEVPLAVNASD